MASSQNKNKSAGKILIQADISGEILLCPEGLSFWGGVDPETGTIIDIHHPCYQQNISGKILMMPSSRGSCSGSGVLLELCLKNIAPAAIIFHEAEEILSLGALVAERIFKKPIPIIKLKKQHYLILRNSSWATIHRNRLQTDSFNFELTVIKTEQLYLSKYDKDILAGKYGNAAKTAMEIICLMAAANDTNTLIDIHKGHIDGCILAHSANLIFAEKLAALGAQVRIPTTINAISVERENWLSQMETLREDITRLEHAYVIRYEDWLSTESTATRTFKTLEGKILSIDREEEQHYDHWRQLQYFHGKVGTIKPYVATFKPLNPSDALVQHYESRLHPFGYSCLTTQEISFLI